VSQGEPTAARWLEYRVAAAAATLEQFEDWRFEYRRLFSGVWGTFLLVVVAAGGGEVGAQAFGADLTLAMKGLAPGMMVMGIIFFMGTTGGAHLNPAVTLAFTVRGNFPWKRVPGYILPQFLGATLAALVLHSMFGGMLAGAALPAEGLSASTAVLMEGLLTLGLVSVILGTATGAHHRHRGSRRRRQLHRAGFGVGGSGQRGVDEPHPVALGPTLVGWDLTDYRVHVVGPLVGAVIAVGFEWILRGPPTEAGADPTRGPLGPENPAGL
jgi:aquaporin Z